MAAALEVADGVVRDVRLALGAVAPVPWRAHRAEQALLGRPATEQALRGRRRRRVGPAQPLRDNGYKIPLVRNLIVRTLSELSEAS